MVGSGVVGVKGLGDGGGQGVRGGRGKGVGVMRIRGRGGRVGWWGSRVRVVV